MSALTSSSPEDRLESLLKPYRDRSNAHIEAIWEEFAAEHPAGAFPSSRTMPDNSMLFNAALRIRSLAERAIEGATDLDASVRLELLCELTQVDLVLSDGQGLDIDFERADRIPEADYVRMSGAKTARLYLGAAATAAIAARA